MRARVPAAADLVVLAVAFVALLAWSWGTWPDVLVDFGRELYAAWRLSRGEVLYRDVASFYGPLSPYVNALWFRLFGVGLRTLVLANLVLLAAATLLLRALLLRAGTRRAAAGAAALVFLCVCGFSRLVQNGSFNFVCPYAHEATHGFLLALAALVCALRAGDPRAHPSLRPALLWSAGAGLLCGLCFLTKPEPFVAGLGASALALALSAGPRPARERVALGAAFAAALVLPAVLAFALLARAMSADEAARATLGSWAYLDNADLLGQRYFAWSMGLDDPRQSLLRMAGALGREALLLLPALGLAWTLRGRPGPQRWAAPAAGLLTLGGLIPFARARWWFGLARPLPLWTLAVLLAAALAWKRGGEAAHTRACGARLALATLALLLLPRIVLNARVFHYGFVLAGPALALLVAALLDWIPRGLDGAGAAGRVFAAAAGAAVIVAVVFHLTESQSRMEALRQEVGQGPDRFRADARGGYVRAVVEALAQMPGEDPTLAVLPEGVMINYLARRPTSVPYLTMLPVEEDLFGEDELLGALQRRPPHLVALVHRSTGEFGPEYFGTDYAVRTLQWVRAGYAPLFAVGDPPLQPQARFGIAVLQARGSAR